jgi:hypothetical protein
LPATSYTPQLRPLSVGEILDAGFRLLRYRFWTLVLSVLVPIVPLTIVATILQASTDENAYDLNSSATTSDSGASLVGALLGGVLQGAAIALAIAACIKVISAAYLGERAGVGDSLRYGMSRILALIGAYLLTVLILIPGFIALIIPAIFLAVKLSVTFPAVIVERAGPPTAIRRSFNLTRGNWWRVFAVVVVVFLIAAVINFALTGVLIPALLADDVSEVTVAVLDTILSIITFAITYPLWASVLTVLYYDLRVRNEGFDLQLLAQGVGADTSRFETAPERPAAAPAPGSTAPPSSAGGFAPPEGPVTSS